MTAFPLTFLLTLVIIFFFAVGVYPNCYLSFLMVNCTPFVGENTFRLDDALDVSAVAVVRLGVF